MTTETWVMVLVALVILGALFGVYFFALVVPRWRREAPKTHPDAFFRPVIARVETRMEDGWRTLDEEEREAQAREWGVDPANPLWQRMWDMKISRGVSDQERDQLLRILLG